MTTIKRLDVRCAKKKMGHVYYAASYVRLYMLAEADAKEVFELLAAFIDFRPDLFQFVLVRLM